MLLSENWHHYFYVIHLDRSFNTS